MPVAIKKTAVPIRLNFINLDMPDLALCRNGFLMLWLPMTSRPCVLEPMVTLRVCEIKGAGYDEKKVADGLTVCYLNVDLPIPRKHIWVIEQKNHNN
jgi:hypothetical protein